METNEQTTEVRFQHYNPTFDLCRTLDKDGLLFYFFRKWTQTLSEDPKEYSELAAQLKEAVEKNENLSEEDKKRLFDQLNNSWGKFGETFSNWGRAVEKRRLKTFPPR